MVQIARTWIFAALLLCAAAGAPATASAATLSTDKPVYRPNLPIIVDFAGLPGNTTDWITVVPANAPANRYDQWCYLGGAASGSREFHGLTPGRYEARAYYNWSDGGYNVRLRAAFIVAAGPVRWHPVSVETMPYGRNATGHAEAVKRVHDAAAKLLNKANPEVGKVVEKLPEAFSVTKAVDVVVTYAQVDEESGLVLNTRVVELEDRDAAHWWAKDAAQFKQGAGERDRALLRNTPH